MDIDLVCIEFGSTQKAIVKMMQYLLIFIGGGAGSLLRYFISKYLNSLQSNFLPLGTLMANVISCFILGIVIQKHLEHRIDDPIKWLLAIGFCGGMSTFSTFAFEIMEYIQKGQIAFGVSYILLSIILGAIMLFWGMKVVSV